MSVFWLVYDKLDFQSEKGVTVSGNAYHLLPSLAGHPYELRHDSSQRLRP
jgi:hypothetical protein